VQVPINNKACGKYRYHSSLKANCMGPHQSWGN